VNSPRNRRSPTTVALFVERLDADVVEIGRSVDGGTAVRLGDDQELALPRTVAGFARQPSDVGSLRLVGAQDAQAGAGDRDEALSARGKVVGLDWVLSSRTYSR
jgi:hypothetical protein